MNIWYVRDTYRRYLIETITNAGNGTVLNALSFEHDLLGRITNRNGDTFSYNARSEVIGAVIGTNDYGYAYDAIGNRVWSAENALTNTYTANCLNQYTAAGSVFPVYDADGNMRWDVRMWHTWDAENRLTRSEPGWDGSTNGAVMVDNRYDYRHRRCSKTVRRLSGRGAGYPFDPSQGGTWDVVETRTFIYDGWNLCAEVVVDAQAGTTNVTRYLWGPDLSGTLRGAGVVGGLLAVIRSDGTFFPCYDANGNITDYVDGNGTVRAHYEYSPFGETIVQSGDLAHTFRFRFSTKYWDEETRSYYYGYRHYAPKLGCLLSRDPIEEIGGINLYPICSNDLINKLDRLGLWSLSFKGEWAASEINMVQSTFDTLKSRMPIYLTGWKSWALAASNLPDECAYKKSVQQELTVIYQILSMIQDGLNSLDTMNVYKKNYGDKANASVGMPWDRWPYNLGNTFNGNLYLNSGGSNPFVGWSNADMNVTIFHELSHVANVRKDDGSDGMWSDYAHRVESIARHGSDLVLSPMVEWNNVKKGNKCCPPIREWIPVRK